jgi:hypothetical protein
MCRKAGSRSEVLAASIAASMMKPFKTSQSIEVLAVGVSALRPVPPNASSSFGISGRATAEPSTAGTRQPQRSLTACSPQYRISTTALTYFDIFNQPILSFNMSLDIKLLTLVSNLGNRGANYAMNKHFLTNKVWRRIRHKDPLPADASSFSRIPNLVRFG